MEATIHEIVTPSIYKPLDNDNFEIRILSLLPGTYESDIVCTLTKTSHISLTRYSALSYCWGDPDVRTEITVNDIVTRVTVNLADALRQLRQLGVSPIWADALCINQEDAFEKSYQIRYMKHIYARSEQTYAWIGDKEADQSVKAISFLQRVLDNSDGTILVNITHDCRATEIDSESIQLDQQDVTNYPLGSLPIILPPNYNGNCQRCILELQFRGFNDLFDRAFWKRRWIIQELAVSPQVRVLCGNIGIQFDDMSSAIGRCERSCYWRPEGGSAYLYLKSIQKFRQDYRNATDLSLFKAISRSHQFHSGDSRDAIYALLGLCYDGVDFVPIPNYKQPINYILRSVTKILISRTTCLDVICIKKTTQQPSTTIPSWALNLVQKSSLPTEAYQLPSLRLQFERLLIPVPDLENCNVLRVQGVIMGSIANMTSTLDSSNPPRPSTNEARNFLGPIYYHCEIEVLAALLSCLLTDNRKEYIRFGSPKEEFWAGDYHPGFFRKICFGLLQGWSRHLAWNTLQVFRQRASFCTSHLESTEASGQSIQSLWTAFNEWISTNRAFTIHRKTLQGCFMGRSLGLYTASVLGGSRTQYDLFFAAAILLVSTPFIVLTTLSIVLFIDSAIYTVATIILCLEIFFLVVLVFPWSQIIRKTRKFRDFVKDIQGMLLATLTDKSVLNTKLVVSDKGFVGRACASAEIGDKICLVVGCTKAVVLREVQDENRV